MKHNKFVFFLLACCLAFAAQAQNPIKIEHVEPPFWWVGMKEPKLQLMVHGQGIGKSKVALKNAPVKKGAKADVTLEGTASVQNENYIFVNLNISEKAQAGKLPIAFELNGQEYVMEYELKERVKDAKRHQGFSPADVIYLLMPDRFANGDPSNDRTDATIELPNREASLGRHGGDIKGIRDHLSYFTDLGVTALWLNPVQENNMDKHSYHGYAITDLYKIDPRFGTNDDYVQLVNEAHAKGIKVVMDMVFNHIGINHWWMKDLPMDTWVHQHPEFTRSNFRAEAIMDPHASEADKTKMLTGWFDTTMPDLDQRNPFLATYLIQNSVWWIEYSGLDGIRMDTYPYPYKEFMATWAQHIMKEYPSFNIVGESWMQKVSHEAYWQKDVKMAGYQSHLPSVTDFPVYHAICGSFHESEGWLTGMANIYYVICQDFLYTDPFGLVTFADNHDVTRLYTTLGRDYRKFKMAMAFMLTTRGIPQFYYGTEILMEGDASDHGLLRKDFPGGWAGDAVNVFEMKGLTGQQQDGFKYVQRLMQWRKQAKAIHKGKLTHFVPEDGIYVYFRYTDTETVMVVLNNNETSAKKVNTARFAERMKGFASGVNVESGEQIGDLSQIDIPAKSALIIELRK